MHKSYDMARIFLSANTRKYALVHVVLDLQQIVGHGLQSELVKQRGDAVEAAVEDQQLRPGFLGSLAHRRLVRLVGVQLLLHHLGQLQVAVEITEQERIYYSLF